MQHSAITVISRLYKTNQIQNKHRKLPKNAERRSNRPAAAKDLTSMVANRKLPLSTDAPC